MRANTEKTVRQKVQRLTALAWWKRIEEGGEIDRKSGELENQEGFKPTCDSAPKSRAPEHASRV